MRLRFAVALASAGAVCGCAIHPLPEDFSRATTYDIVASIRCEVKHGLEDFPASYPGRRADFPSNRFLSDTAIGFLFEFDMKESDKANEGKLEFSNPFSGGSFALNLSGKAEKERNTHRTFLVGETLLELQTSEQCNDDKAHPNFIYPIAGHVGADEVLSTYLRLTRDLSVKAHNDKLFSDELKFTTTLTSGITPTLELNGGSTKFKLRKFSVNGNLERTDEHKVTIALAHVEGSGQRSARLAGRNFVVYEPTGRFLRSTAPVIQPSDGNEAKDLVIQELYRLRALDEDKRVLESTTPAIP